jgi:hypothetical protein
MEGREKKKYPKNGYKQQKTRNKIRGKEAARSGFMTTNIEHII